MVKLFCLWGNQLSYLGKLVSYLGNTRLKLKKSTGTMTSVNKLTRFLVIFPLVLLAIFSSPASPSRALAYSIGDTGPGGGIIFYDAGSQQSWGQYLEAAPANWDGTNDSEDPYVQWGCRGTSIQTATAIGTGAANTSAIIAGCSGTTAASTARAYAGGGKSDWYLPSRDELEQMEVRRSILGFDGYTWHWSSSQYSAEEANSRWLGTESNTLYFYWKDFGDQVRPIRAIQGEVPYFNLVQNLTATANANGSATLTWAAPTASNTAPYMYGVYWYDLTVIDGAESGGWAVWTYANTLTYTVNPSDQTGYGPVRFKVRSGTAPCVGEGSGSCLYSADVSVDVTIVDPTPPTTTTSTTTTSTSTTSTILMPTTTTSTTIVSPINDTTTTEPVTTTTIKPVTTTTEVKTVETPASPDNPKDDEPATPVPQYAAKVETTPIPEIDVPKNAQDAADVAVASIFNAPISNAKLADAVDDLVADAGTPEELTAVVNSLLDQELTDTQFSTVIDSVFSEPLSDENFSAAVDAVFADTSKLSDEQFDTAVQAVFDEPLTTEQFSAALEAVFDEPITDEKFDAIIDAVLDEPFSDEQFEELVNVLESDTVTEEQVAAAVDSVIENGVTEDQATDLATSEKVLQSIDGEQATEIFDAVDISNVTLEEAAALVEAVQDAPTEVRESMESEINVFDGAIDTYVPLGSAVDVGTRRVVVAAAAAAMGMTMGGGAPSAPSGPSGPSGSSGGGGGGGGGPSENKKTSNRRRIK